MYHKSQPTLNQPQPTSWLCWKSKSCMDDTTTTRTPRGRWAPLRHWGCTSTGWPSWTPVSLRACEATAAWSSQSSTGAPSRTPKWSRSSRHPRHGRWQPATRLYYAVVPLTSSLQNKFNCFWQRRGSFLTVLVRFRSKNHLQSVNNKPNHVAKLTPVAGSHVMRPWETSVGD